MGQAANVSRRSGRLLRVVLALSLSLAGCGGGSSGSHDDGGRGQTTSPPGVLSISAYYYTEPAAANDAEWLQRYLQAYQLARSAGADGQFQSYHWNDLEPTAGHYDTAKVQDLANTLANGTREGLTQLVGLQVINTVTREVPTGLTSAAWDSTAMQNAFRGLLDQLIPHLRNHVRYLSIGNEVDVYFQNANPAEQEGYRIFFANAAQYLRQQLPGVQVGITITAGGWLSGDPRWPQLDSNSDVMISTYYPLQPDFTVQPPQQPAKDFPDLLALAGTKTLVLQEVGYPSSTLNNSSEAQQAEFIRQVFATWRDSNGRIPFLNLFMLHDFDSNLLDTMTQYYGSSDPVFRAYLASLGLRNRNNTDKQAWPALLDAAHNASLR